MSNVLLLQHVVYLNKLEIKKGSEENMEEYNIYR